MQKVHSSPFQPHMTACHWASQNFGKQILMIFKGPPKMEVLESLLEICSTYNEEKFTLNTWILKTECFSSSSFQITTEFSYSFIILVEIRLWNVSTKSNTFL